MRLTEEKLKPLITDGTLIMGGHFMVNTAGKPILNPGTVNSFEVAVNLYVWAKNKGLKNIKLALLINDIGTTCSEKACVIGGKLLIDRQSYRLPKEYLEILAEAQIKNSELLLMWERHLRNRAMLRFRRHYLRDFKNLIKLQDGSYWLVNKNIRIILTRGAKQGTYGIPACPLIMASLTEEQGHIGATQSLNVWYIADDNRENIPNHFILEKGKTVASVFGISTKIINAYMMGNELLISS